MMETLMMLTAISSASSADIERRIGELQSPLRVLYVAAHPDDENTQMLAWIEQGLGAQAAYLSLTRGDGGQNLIGAEQRPLLGVIRSLELLEARKIDGARQWVTRLRDFGFSKSGEEALSVWGEEAALADVVRVFRTFRPHVVITRFPEEGPTHGHHLASARLARRAFEASSDTERFREQIAAGLISWRPLRMFYNYPHFWASRGKPPPEEGRYEVDVGGYAPLLGRSFGEISAASRSMHKSQGFGASARYGSWKESLILLEGSQPSTEDAFSGLPEWTDLEGGAAFAESIANVLERFDGAAPAKSIPWLGRAHRAAEELRSEPERTRAQKAIESLLLDCAGVLVDARAEVPELSPGASSKVSLRVHPRAEGAEVVLRRIEGPGIDLLPRKVLGASEVWEKSVSLEVPEAAEPSTPHWLSIPPEPARYPIPDGDLGILPWGPPPLTVSVEVGVGGVGILAVVPVSYHWVDPVHGERARTVEVTPPVTVTPRRAVAYVPRGGNARIEAEVRAGDAGWSGKLSFGGIDAAPEPVALKLGADEAQTVSVDVRTLRPSELSLRVASGGEGAVPAWSKRVIDHPHVPVVGVRLPARVKLSPVELEVPEGLRVGFLPGTGEATASILRGLGLEVEELSVGSIRSGELDGLDTLLLGVRAFNVSPELKDMRGRLWDWVASGKTLVVQYNTNNRNASLDYDIGPAPITIARGRVTDEAAQVDLLQPKHPLLRFPHVIREPDFEGWVQERGLYFAEKWDSGYTPLFSMHDAGEEPLEGSTLVKKHGKGTYIYTGLSFFRQLPAGNPGALRLLVNFLSAGKAPADVP